MVNTDKVRKKVGKHVEKGMNANKERENETEAKQSKQTSKHDQISLTSGSKSDFVKQFIFYFAFILALLLVAYILAILPSLFNPKQIKPYPSNQSTGVNQESQISILNQTCINSLTQDSIKYKLNYTYIININNQSNQNLNGKIEIEDLRIGWVSFSFEKQANHSIQTFVRKIIFFISGDELNKYYGNYYQNSSNNLNIQQPSSITLIQMDTFLLRDKDLACINSTFILISRDQTFTQNGECSAPDIPFRVCKENIKELTKEIIYIGDKEYNTTKYLLEISDERRQQISMEHLSGQLQNQYFWFADLPFPIQFGTDDVKFVLTDYSKVEDQ